jgi:hypothetical protein
VTAQEPGTEAFQVEKPDPHGKPIVFDRALQGATIVSRASRTVSDFDALIEMLPVWFDQRQARTAS